jgi:hypothetical protein
VPPHGNGKNFCYKEVQAHQLVEDFGSAFFDERAMTKIPCRETTFH